jgi:hypothetical protein
VTAPYVPQVGDTIAGAANPVHHALVLIIDYDKIGVRIVASDDELLAVGTRLWMPISGPWVKVDKPPPWPEVHEVRQRVDGLIEYLTDFERLSDAVKYCAKIKAPRVDLRICAWRPDGSVTVLDHTGKAQETMQ